MVKLMRIFNFCQFFSNGYIAAHYKFCQYFFPNGQIAAYFYFFSIFFPMAKLHRIRESISCYNSTVEQWLIQF